MYVSMLDLHFGCGDRLGLHEWGDGLDRIGGIGGGGEWKGGTLAWLHRMS